MTRAKFFIRDEFLVSASIGPRGVSFVLFVTRDDPGWTQPLFTFTLVSIDVFNQNSRNCDGKMFMHVEQFEGRK